MLSTEDTADSPSISPGSRRPSRASRRGSHDAAYDIPDRYANLDELEAPTAHGLDGGSRRAPREARQRRRSRPRSSSRPGPAAQTQAQYDIPDTYANLDELAGPSPVENPDEEPIYLHRSLEEGRRAELAYQRDEERRTSVARGEVPREGEKEEEPGIQRVSRAATQLYVISYLILFSFLGTLLRLGLQAITFYPGAPVAFGVLWANFGGSVFMGFLAEDRMLFKEEWGTATYDQLVLEARRQVADEERAPGSMQGIDLEVARKAHATTKKTIPLYIGLATGFCGCFTSFSSFIRDVYLALSNGLPTPLGHPADYDAAPPGSSPTVSRNGGYSFMALLAVIVTTIALCMSGLRIGAHIALALEPYTPSLPFTFCRKVLDRIAVLLAWGCWIGAILLAVFPPDRHGGGPEIWRGRAVFALVFAPLGCLGRFYASIYLNGRFVSFPLGTFVVNIFGTAILGMSYDLQHVPLGGVVGCQVLQGIQDGFCGCLTTVSTWVTELSALRRWNAYRYGAASVVVALCSLIVIMGSMQWTNGFRELTCTH